jgi:signal transduction histidine kinase
MGARRDLWGLRAGGEEFPIEASTISRIDTGGRRRYTVFLRDITTRHQAEARLSRSHAQLRELSSRLRTLQEEERTRISREIHDELGQMLTAIRMDLRWLEKRLVHIEDAAARRVCADKLAGTVALVDDTTRTVQKIAAELRPALLDNLGLATAIGDEAARFAQRTGVACDVRSDGGMAEAPPEVATAVFRIFQEILTNVARHAAATRVTVRLGGEAGMVELVAADNGRGIAPQPPSLSSSAFPGSGSSLPRIGP